MRGITWLSGWAASVVAAGVLTNLASGASVHHFPLQVSPDELPATSFLAVHARPTPGLPDGISYGQFNWDGPILDTHKPLSQRIGEVAANADGSRVFGMGGHEVYELSPSGGATQLTPQGVPELSWTMGMTYDTKRDRLITATLGGEGFLYSYQPGSDEWSVLASLNNLDLTAIAYFPPNDHFYGLSQQSRDGRLTLHEYDSDGQLLGSQPTDLALVASFIDRSVQLVAAGDYLALIQYPGSRQFPPPSVDPVIQALQVANGDTFLVIPEPSSLAVAAISIACLASGALRKRRRRSSAE